MCSTGLQLLQYLFTPNIKRYVYIYIYIYIHPPLLRATPDHFFPVNTPRAEPESSDTNPKPVLALGNAKRKKILTISTTASRLRKKRTSPLLRMNSLTLRFFLADHICYHFLFFSFFLFLFSRRDYIFTKVKKGFWFFFMYLLDLVESLWTEFISPINLRK